MLPTQVLLFVIEHICQSCRLVFLALLCFFFFECGTFLHIAAKHSYLFASIFVNECLRRSAPFATDLL